MSDTYYGIDPVFNDASEFIECDKCESEFDRSEYDSDTCQACEDDTNTLEGEGE